MLTPHGVPDARRHHLTTRRGGTPSGGRRSGVAGRRGRQREHHRLLHTADPREAGGRLTAPHPDRARRRVHVAMRPRLPRSASFRTQIVLGTAALMAALMIVVGLGTQLVLELTARSDIHHVLVARANAVAASVRTASDTSVVPAAAVEPGVQVFGPAWHGARRVRRAASRRRCPRAGPARRDRRGGRRRRTPPSRPVHHVPGDRGGGGRQRADHAVRTFGALRLVGHRCPRPDRGRHGRAPRPPGHRPGARAGVADGHPGGGLERARPRPAFRPRSSHQRAWPCSERPSTTCSSESPERSDPRAPHLRAGPRAAHPADRYPGFGRPRADARGRRPEAPPEAGTDRRLDPHHGRHDRGSSRPGPREPRGTGPRLLPRLRPGRSAARAGSRPSPLR